MKLSSLAGSRLRPGFVVQGGRRGVTLVELLIAVMVSAVLIGALCEMYLVLASEFERQQGEGDALACTSFACSRIAEYAVPAINAQTYTRYAPNDALCIKLPADMAYGVYVPVQVGSRVEYRDGQQIMFYLSDSTGSYYRRGSILWAGVVNSLWPSVSVTPDQSWSLYPGGTQGRIILDSVRFDVVIGVRASVTISARRTYRIGRTQKTLSAQRTVCLENSDAHGF